MGTIVDKFNYSFEAKDLIKDSINNLGGSITSETELKEYAQELDNIYDNIPKTTGEDTNLSLTTIKGKMNIIPKGDTQQNGTPTPSTPIDIEVVTGTQEVKVENVNLFIPDVTGLFKLGCNVSESNGEITITATQNGDIYVGNVVVSGNSYATERGVKIPVAPLTSYILSLTNSDVNKLFITEYDSNNISLGFVQANTITTQANTSYITIRYGLENAVNGTTYKTKIQLEKGSTATTYTPHQEQTQTISLGDIELCKIGNYQDYLYKTSGKNLNDMSYWNTNTGSGITLTNNKDGSINVNGTATGLMVYKLSNAIQLKANTTYYITGGYSENCRIDLRDNNLQTYGSSSIGVNSVGTYTPTTDVTAYLCIRVPSGITISNVKMLPMISTENNIPFEPYGSGKWYKKEYIGKHILSTSDTWALNRNSNNLYQYRTKNDLLEDVITSPDPYSRAVALCNYYTKGDINGMTTQCFNIGGLKYIGITSDISTLANFNTFITNNSIYVYYVCQTPTDIEITNTTLINQLNNLEKAQSYNGVTNISSNGNLPIVLGVSALKGE